MTPDPVRFIQINRYYFGYEADHLFSNGSESGELLGYAIPKDCSVIYCTDENHEELTINESHDRAICQV